MATQPSDPMLLPAATGRPATPDRPDLRVPCDDRRESCDRAKRRIPRLPGVTACRRLLMVALSGGCEGTLRDAPEVRAGAADIAVPGSGPVAGLARPVARLGPGRLPSPAYLPSSPSKNARMAWFTASGWVTFEACDAPSPAMNVTRP